MRVLNNTLSKLLLPWFRLTAPHSRLGPLLSLPYPFLVVCCHFRLPLCMVQVLAPLVHREVARRFR